MPDITLPEIFQFENRFYETFADPAKPICADSPELVFIDRICKGDIDGAVDLFDENQQFGGERSAVDAPQGRFEGLDEIRSFAENWLSYAQADSSVAIPVVQTRSGGRSCTEIVVRFRYDQYDKTVEFPMCVVGDIRGGNRLDEVRIYFFFKWQPALSPYRHRIFKPSHNESSELNSMCNVIREYIYILGEMQDEEGLDRMMDTMDDDVIYGGYRPESISPVIQGKEIVRKKYRSFVSAPGFVRFESIIDDGITSVCEWVGVPREDGRGDPSKADLLQSGVGIYVRNPETGKLKEIRIIDYARFQNEIDYSKIKIRY